MSRSFLMPLLVLAVAACRADEDSRAGPGTFTLPLQHAGEDREAIVYVPESYDPDQPSPVLLHFHGFGGMAADHLDWADFRPQAEAHGFILVVPQGSLLEGETHWNTSPLGGDNKSEAEDFGFVEALLDEIAVPYAIDPTRVYAAGYSNGGMFAHALACYRSERIAGIAAVSGVMLDDVGACDAPPTAVIILHGTSDFVLPYEGGDGWPSTAEAVDYWVGQNGISGTPATETRGDVESFVYTGGTAGMEVHHHKVNGGDHVWLDLEFASTNDVIWDFLSRFDRDGALVSGR